MFQRLLADPHGGATIVPIDRRARLQRYEYVVKNGSRIKVVAIFSGRLF